MDTGRGYGRGATIRFGFGSRSRGRGSRMDKTLVVCNSSKLTDPFGELKVFAGKASQGLARSICQQLGIELARSETKVFSEGNVFVRVLENVRGRDVFIV